jgi:multiple sugar transport system permease protein
MRAVISYVLLVLLAIALMAPFAWMVLVSLHPSKAALPSPAHMFPPDAKWHFENYLKVLTMPDIPFWRFLANTSLVTAAVVSGQLFVTSLAAYAFARMTFRGRNVLFFLFIATMMIPGQVTMIPAFILVRDFGWLDTYWALIVPGLSSAFAIFLLRQFFMGIPKELEEAARLDGCGDFGIYWRVALPLTKPALATLAAFSFIAVWTDFFWPLLVTSSMEMRTLEVGLSVFKDSFGGMNWPLQMTAAVIVLIPVLLVFLFTQRFFTKGIALTGMK